MFEPEEAELAERRSPAISLLRGLSAVFISCRNMYMSWQPSLCSRSISLQWFRMVSPKVYITRFGPCFRPNKVVADVEGNEDFDF